MAQKSRYMVAVVDEINPSSTSVTIASGGTNSTILECGGTSPTGIIFPSGWSTGNVSFKVCKTPGGSFVPLTNFDGSSFSITAAPSTWVPLQPAQFNSVLYVQVISSATQSSSVVVDFALAPIFQGIHA